MGGGIDKKERREKRERNAGTATLHDAAVVLLCFLSADALRGKTRSISNVGKEEKGEEKRTMSANVDGFSPAATCFIGITCGGLAGLCLLVCGSPCPAPSLS